MVNGGKDLTNPAIALSIGFNDEVYKQGEEARKKIVEQITHLPEIREVWYTANGIDADTFNVVVTDPKHLDAVKNKIETIPGVEQVFKFR